jgi:uncharacterized protein (TIGR00290 family)
MNRSKGLISWSGGKDSSMCYHVARNSTDFEIAGLLTTVTEDYQRISMHGVRRELLKRQAEELKLPLHEVMIPKNTSNEIYETRMEEKLLDLKERENISKVVFGDLFLGDIRAYREKFLAPFGLECEFPLWGRNTSDLAKYFVNNGFKAITCCVDPKKIGKDLCGREYDSEFLADLPKTADPCGENGEFHTFVYDGPIFEKKIHVTVGEIVEREGFYFADIQAKRDMDVGALHHTLSDNMPVA